MFLDFLKKESNLDFLIKINTLNKYFQWKQRGS
jgi:hypothetical protein